MTQEERIQANNEELKELHQMMPKQLSRNILEKYLSEEELNKIYRGYRDTRVTYSKRSESRKHGLGIPLTDHEIEMLREFLTDFTTPLTEMARRYGLEGANPSSMFQGRIRSFAIRYLFQNRDALGF